MDTNEQIEVFCNALFEVNDIVEVRNLPDGLRNWVSPSELLKISADLHRENADGKNVYVGVMPRTKRGGGKDCDVTHGFAAWSDFDHMSAIDSRAQLHDNGIPEPTLFITSGNGIHCYWVFEEKQSAAEIRELNKVLADILGSDRKVCNPSRIMRLPGFNNVKDLSNPKPCKILAQAKKVKFAEFRELVIGKVTPKTREPMTNNNKNGEGISEGGRNSFLASLAGTMRRRGMSEQGILAALLVENAAQCNPPLDVSEVEAVAKSVAKYDPAADALAFEGFPLNDIGNGQRLASECEDSIRWCYGLNEWLCWDGTRWSEERGAIERLAKKIALGFRQKWEACPDETLKAALRKHYTYSTKGAAVREMVRQAQSESGMGISPEKLDTNPMLLNVRNGTVELATGKLCTHERANFITKLCPVDFDESATCQKWLEFLARITSGNAELISFLQRAVGYSLSGKTGERVIFILYGTGANGKSTFVETVRVLLGDYAARTPTQTLMVKRSGGIPNDLARLRGKRLVTAAEAETGQRIAESLIKELTGNEAVAARFLYGEFFDFVPEFKIWMSTNYKPEVVGAENAIWDRLRLIPFDVTIPVMERDAALQDKLRAELPGILNWALQGCLAWQKDGLAVPATVKDATSVYREEMDAVKQFLDECCVFTPTQRAEKSNVFGAFSKWCKTERINNRDFHARMKRLGIQESRSGTYRYWDGLVLRNDIE